MLLNTKQYCDLLIPQFSSIVLFVSHFKVISTGLKAFFETNGGIIMSLWAIGCNKHSNELSTDSIPLIDGVVSVATPPVALQC